MLIGTYTQQPADELDYDIPCELASGDSITSATATVAPTGLTVGTPIIFGSLVKLWVSGGVTGTTYKTEVTIGTAQGRRKQVELKFKIKEY